MHKNWWFFFFKEICHSWSVNEIIIATNYTCQVICLRVKQNTKAGIERLRVCRASGCQPCAFVPVRTRNETMSPKINNIPLCGRTSEPNRVCVHVCTVCLGTFRWLSRIFFFPVCIYSTSWIQENKIPQTSQCSSIHFHAPLADTMKCKQYHSKVTEGKSRNPTCIPHRH